ncbi:MAG: DUF1801 domain-containing protein [Planctomycetes bacterium]|nr:DUF1801 domain-containing protein [Planctomycetota bacterium]
MQSNAKTVDEYLESLPADRRAALSEVRRVILSNLDDNYEEGIQYGMIGYYVPHRIYPAGYHCDPKQPLPFVSMASQKNYMSIYLMCVYGSPDEEAWLQKEWTKAGKKLDMGKCCIRFRKIEDLALDVLGKVIRRCPAKKLIAHYQSLQSVTKPSTKKVKASTPKTTTPRKKKSSDK